jgi:hypothetical protein
VICPVVSHESLIIGNDSSYPLYMSNTDLDRVFSENKVCNVLHVNQFNMACVELIWNLVCVVKIDQTSNMKACPRLSFLFSLWTNFVVLYTMVR